MGYQAQGTLGRRIVDGEKKVKILGEEFSVNARVEYIEGFSGHADQQGLVDFACSFRNKMPKHIFLIHGEYESQVALEEKLKEQIADTQITIPDYGQAFTLDEGFEVEQRFENPVKKEIDKIDLINKMQSLESELEDMKHALKEDIRLAGNSDEDMAKLNARVSDLRKQIVAIMNKGEGNEK